MWKCSLPTNPSHFWKHDTSLVCVCVCFLSVPASHLMSNWLETSPGFITSFSKQHQRCCLRWVCRELKSRANYLSGLWAILGASRSMWSWKTTTAQPRETYPADSGASQGTNALRRNRQVSTSSSTSWSDLGGCPSRVENVLSHAWTQSKAVHCLKKENGEGGDMPQGWPQGSWGRGRGWLGKGEAPVVEVRLKCSRIQLD